MSVAAHVARIEARETVTSRAASPVAGTSPGGGGSGLKQVVPPSAAELAAMRQVELKNLNKQARRLEPKQRAEERLRQVRRRCALIQNGCPVLGIQYMHYARIHIRTCTGLVLSYTMSLLRRLECRSFCLLCGASNEIENAL